ncbi:MAG: hypothetical protein AAFX76_02025 [Planctomycetota bacterium]
MDDRTPTRLDDLADLFLTGTGRSDAAPPSPDPLDGPPSIKLPPKPRATLSEPPEPMLDEPEQEGERAPQPTASDYGQPADPGPASATPNLRFTGDDSPGLTPDPLDGPPTAYAEAVVLGNLPGMAGPWLTQYAQLLAQQDGAVAVLHVDSEGIDLELVEPTNTPQPDQTPDEAAAPFRGRGPSQRIPPGGFRGRDLVDVLNQLCRARVAPVRTVLVHLDPTPESLPQLLDLRDWTLLSGADDAAIVAGYRLLKTLLESDDRVARTRVGLMVVGSDHDAGHHAAQKLRSAVANFLHTPLELIGFQPQMIPARCRTLGRFAPPQADWPRLTTWLQALTPPKPRAAEPAPPERDDQAPDRVEAPALPPLDAPVEVEAGSSTPQQKPKVAAGATSGAISGGGGPDLFALIDSDPRAAASIPGGLALEARCPAQPHTQLALDAAGRLHLLHRHDSADGDPPTPKEAIVELVAVRDWARQHRALLQLTERTRHFDPDADPILHLFTDRADQSVHLVARLGRLLRLHLLRPVTVGNEQTYFCTPLSA